MAAAAAAAGISGFQQIEGLPLTSEVREASLWQVPGAVDHVLTVGKADLVQIVRRGPPRGEAVQPGAPAPAGSARLAVLGWLLGQRLWKALAQEGSWLFLSLPGREGFLLLLGRKWFHFLLLNRELRMRQLFLKGEGFINKRAVHGTLPFSRELEARQCFLLDWDAYHNGRWLYFTLALKGKLMLRGVRVIQEKASGQGWGRRRCIAHLLNMGLWPVLWLQLLLL